MLALLLGTLLLLILLGVPIVFCIMASCILFLSVTGLQPLFVVAQRMVSGTDSFVLIAVPLFILVGNLMDVGGISRRLVKWADSVVGYFCGGIGYVAILSCAVFAALTGSGPATVAAIGSILIPSMMAKGYPRHTTVGMLACAGCLGPIIPPSIPMIIYSVTMGISVVDMFIGGILPGILIAFLLSLVNFVISYKTPAIRDTPRTSFSLKTFLQSTWNALFALFLPVFVLGGIYAGIFSPTEAAGAAVIYSLVVGLLIYKELKIRDLPRLFFDSFKTAAMACFITGVANVLSFIIANAQFSDQVVAFLSGYMTNQTTYLIVLMLLLFIVGALFDTLPSIILIAPLLIPTGIGLGLDPLHLGVLFVINMVVGFVTPPFGVNLFTVIAITGTKFSDVVKGIIPFLVVEILAVWILAFCPWLITWLPRTIGN